MPTLLVSSEHFKSVLENLNDILDDKHVPNQDSTNDKTKVHIYFMKTLKKLSRSNVTEL